jgi:hypothetical protein
VSTATLLSVDVPGRGLPTFSLPQTATEASHLIVPACMDISCLCGSSTNFTPDVPWPECVGRHRLHTGLDSIEQHFPSLWSPFKHQTCFNLPYRGFRELFLSFLSQCVHGVWVTLNKPPLPYQDSCFPPSVYVFTDPLLAFKTENSSAMYRP